MITIPTRLPSRVPFNTVAPPEGRDPDLRAVAKRLGAKIVLSPSAPPGSVEQYRRLAATLHHAQAQTGHLIR